MHEELIKTEEKEGFTIRFYACEEDCSPDGQFASGDDEADKEVLRKIASGELTWFCAKMTASKEGVELADDYLGCCCYNSVQEFIDQNDYYKDMQNNVIMEARKKIKSLCAA